MSIAIAREAARRLARDAGLSPPVDIEELLGWRGLALDIEHEWPAALCARYYSAERRIAVNGKHSRVRQRFSISHEVGHFVLGHDQVDIDHGVAAIFGDEDESYAVVGDIEQEANAFAVELLMPREWVRQQSEGRSMEDLIAIIHRDCDVSEPAAWYRVMDLKLGAFGPPPRRRR